MRQHPLAEWFYHLGGHLSFLGKKKEKKGALRRARSPTDTSFGDVEDNPQVQHKWACALEEEVTPPSTPHLVISLRSLPFGHSFRSLPLGHSFHQSKQKIKEGMNIHTALYTHTCSL